MQARRPGREFRLPPLGGSPCSRRVFTSVYYDVPGGSLADGGITLRRRTENGHGVPAAEAPGRQTRASSSKKPKDDRGSRPRAMLALLHAHLRRSPLGRRSRAADAPEHGALVARNGTTAEVTRRRGDRARLDRSRASHLGSRSRSSSAKAIRTARRDRRRALVSGRRAGRGPAEAVPGARPHVGCTARQHVSLEELRSRLRAQLREIERHDLGTRLGRDPESLHDMRVGVRRLRALLRAGGSS